VAVLNAFALYPLAVWHLGGRALTRITTALTARTPA
jgi:hypothetical protein